MSRQIALEALNPSYRGERIPVWEAFSGCSREVVQHLTGYDPLAPGGPGIRHIYRTLAEKLDIDVLGSGLPADDAETFDWSDGETIKTNRRGQQCVQWGVFHSRVQEDGRHFLHIPKPATLDEALQFDPLPYFPYSTEDHVEFLTQQFPKMEEAAGDIGLVVPGYYTTAFHWPLAVLGFEMLCEAGLEENDFAELMKRCVEVTKRLVTAWSRVPGVKVFTCHDDLAMSGGLIFHPDWYRRHIIPHYREIFKPLKEAGIQIVFVSDGDCSALMDDIFDAGADGFNFEWLIPLRPLVERHGDKILVGNLNSHTLAAGPIEKIEAEVRECIEVGRHAPRFAINVGGQLTHDISPQHMDAYLNIRNRLCREARRGMSV